MAATILSKLARAVFVVFVAASATFFLIHAAPGDPFSEVLENPNISASAKAHWRELYGLDKPITEQYVAYISNAARGDLGWSFSMNRPVRDVMMDAVPKTALLAIVTLILSFTIGILLGVYQVLRNGSWQERLLSGSSLFVYSLPSFWIALMAMLIFAYWFPVLPVAGATDAVMYDLMNPMEKLVDRIRHMVLPVSVLTLLSATGIARYQRAELLRVVNQDFVRTARAKGLSSSRAIMRHALRNALIPIVTYAGLFLPVLVTGAVFIEKIFSWPGMGYTIINAISARDYPLVMAGVIAGSVMVVTGSLLADFVYTLVDPRLREA